VAGLGSTGCRVQLGVQLRIGEAWKILSCNDSSPARLGTEDRWAALVAEVGFCEIDPTREGRLWDTTAELLTFAT
jgi:hypothetical protein